MGWQRELAETLLDNSKRIRIMECEANNLADVAELADAQVSEACGGNIVEVQVLSSAPGKNKLRAAKAGSLFCLPQDRHSWCFRNRSPIQAYPRGE